MKTATLKLIAFTLALTVVSVEGWAQKNKKNNQESQTTEQAPAPTKASASGEFERYESIYKMALSYGDGVVAKQAVYQMMALKPEREDLKDTLAFLYFNMNQGYQTITLASEILKNKTDNTLLEMRAVSYKNLGGVKEALDDYENLYKETKNVLYLYEMSTLQYSLKRYGEAEAATNIILQDKGTQEAKVAVNIGQGRQQEVPLNAAVHNLRGVIALDMKNEALAKQNFEKALELFPDFLLAKNNLKVLEEQGKPKPKTGAR